MSGHLEDDEELVGWYTNPPPNEGKSIVFTTMALCLVDDGREERIAFSDIVGYELPQSKRSATGVALNTVRGHRFVPMHGRNGPEDRYADAWILVRALHTIVGRRPA